MGLAVLLCWVLVGDFITSAIATTGTLHAVPSSQPTDFRRNNDAAVHLRSSTDWNSELHTLTQDILASIQKRSPKATGTIISSEPHFDLALEYSIGLHSDLTSMDVLDVLDFEHADKFTVREKDATLIPGTLLVGSHEGKWSLTPGSARALLASNEHANSGGLAYARRVTAVAGPDENGQTHVETTSDIGGDSNIFPHGKVSLGWNHTKGFSRCTIQLPSMHDSAPDQTAVIKNVFDLQGTIFRTTSRARTGEEFLDVINDDLELTAIATRVGIGRHLDWKSDFCDSQCSKDSVYYGTAYDYLQSDDSNELCIYCFEFSRTLSAFEFNYAGSTQATQSTLYPAGSSASNIKCINCYAYLGATVWMIADWGDRTSFLAGIGGSVGYNFDLQVSSGSSSFSSTQTLSSVNRCIPTISLYGGLIQLRSDCVLEASASGGTSSFIGEVSMKSSLAASKSIGGGYDSLAGGYRYDATSAFSYTAPYVSGYATSGSADLAVSFKPKAVLTASVGIANIMTLNMKASVGIRPMLSAKMVPGRRRMLSMPSEDNGDGDEGRIDNDGQVSPPPLNSFSLQLVDVVVDGDELPLGGTVDAVVELTEDVEHVIFEVTSRCWNGMSLVLMDAGLLSSGRTVVSILVPSHVLFHESPCSEYMFSAFSSSSPHEVSKFHLFVHVPGFCQVAPLVTKPEDGSNIRSNGTLLVKWLPEKLFFVHGGSLLGDHAEIAEVAHVAIALVGYFTINAGSSQECLGEININGSLCKETNFITSKALGAPNVGTFLFDLSKNMDGDNIKLKWNGTWVGRYDSLRVKIIGFEHWLVESYSKGSFKISDDEAEGAFEAVCPNIRPRFKELPRAPLLSGVASTSPRLEELVSGGVVSSIRTPRTEVRELSSLYLTLGFSMKAEVNFDSVHINAFNFFTGYLYQDSDTRNPTLSITLTSLRDAGSRYISGGSDDSTGDDWRSDDSGSGGNNDDSTTSCSAGKYATSTPAYTTITVVMSDSYGDGWQSAYLHVQNDAYGSYYLSSNNYKRFTLSSGSYDERYHQFPPGSYSAWCCNDKYQEVSWKIGRSNQYGCAGEGGCRRYLYITVTAKTTTTCYSCPSGKYSSTPDSSSCSSCGAGYYQWSAGQSFCYSCAGGKYQSYTGQSFCYSCGTGKYSSGQSSGCSSCPQGKYNPNTGQSICSPCSAGRYQNVYTQTSCKSCSAGHYGLGGSTSSMCTGLCAAGRYSSAGASFCSICAHGKWQTSSGMTSCEWNPTLAPTEEPTPEPTTKTMTPTVVTVDPMVLVSGPCGLINGNCMTSPNYPSDYGSSESCLFRVWQAGFLHVKAFELEDGYDMMYVDGTSYTNTNGPNGVAVSTGSVVSFSSGTSVAKPGFEVCFALHAPSVQPTFWPTPEPTAPMLCRTVVLSGSYVGRNSDKMGEYTVDGKDGNGNVYFSNLGYYLNSVGLASGNTFWIISHTMGSASGYWYSSAGTFEWPPETGWTVAAETGWTVTPCDFDSDACNFVNTGSHNWVQQSGSTPSSYTGPSSDHTSGLGSYMYIEASSPNHPHVGPFYLESIVAGGVGRLEFWYSMFGSACGTLSVDTFDGGTWSERWKKIGEQGEDWQQASVELNEASISKVRFSAITGSDYAGDIAIDDVAWTAFSDVTPCDFDSDACNFVNAGSHNWVQQSGSTPSSYTGPSSDHTSGLGSYMYIEASSPNYPHVGPFYLESIVAGGVGRLAFWYSMFGSACGTLSVDTFDGGTWSERWKKVGEQGEDWQQASVELNEASISKVRFSAITGSDYAGDIAIDDVAWTAFSDVTLTCKPTTSMGPVVLVSGPCGLINGNCMTSPNYPSDYGSSESCLFRVWQAGFLHVKAFELEDGYDMVYVDGTSYTNTNGPNGVAVSTGSVVSFSSGTSVAKPGFEVCFALHAPSVQPTFGPTLNPTFEPTTSEPTYKPTPDPTFKPTTEPTFKPTLEPTAVPTPEPTFKPTPEPTFKPTPEPAFKPTTEPTFKPTLEPTFTPTPEPTLTLKPTPEPTFQPTPVPTLTFQPTPDPTFKPSPEVSKTLSPTDTDQVLVKVEIALISSIETPSAAQENEIRSAILTNLQEESADIYLRDFTVVSIPNKLRRHDDHDGRMLEDFDISKWHLGSYSQNCDSRCSSLGLFCTPSQITTLNTEQLVDQVANYVGFTCEKYYGGQAAPGLELTLFEGRACWYSNGNLADATAGCALSSDAWNKKLCACDTLPVPTPVPTLVPTLSTASIPTVQPTSLPTLQHTSLPTPYPSDHPSPRPTVPPTSSPSLVPSPVPTPPLTVTTFRWAVTFTVIMNGGSNSPELAQAIVEGAVTSPGFKNAINTASFGVAVDESSITITIITRAPAPDSGGDSGLSGGIDIEVAIAASSTDEKNDGGSKTNAASLGFTIGGCAGALFVIGLLVYMYKRGYKARSPSLRDQIEHLEDTIERNHETDRVAAIKEGTSSGDANKVGWTSRDVDIDDLVLTTEMENRLATLRVEQPWVSNENKEIKAQETQVHGGGEGRLASRIKAEWGWRMEEGGRGTEI